MGWWERVGGGVDLKTTKKNKNSGYIMQLLENCSVLGVKTRTLTNIGGYCYRLSGPVSCLISFPGSSGPLQRDCVGRIRFGVHFHVREGPISSPTDDPSVARSIRTQLRSVGCPDSGGNGVSRQPRAPHPPALARCHINQPISFSSQTDWKIDPP